MLPLSLYIHFPWCIKKCPYCDFNSHAAKSAIPETQYVQQLLADLAADIARYHIDRPIISLFMGGGTPSLFSPEAFDRLLTGVKQQLTLADDIEITLEANPGTFESGKFKEFRQLGINRLSIGVQSFDDGLLNNLGRVHSGLEAIKAAEIAHQAGFDNFNLDLMYGVPGATTASSLKDMATAISLAPSHISFYQMTLEPNTYFYRFPPPLPQDEIIYDSQNQCQQKLAQAGYSQYEISAYSQPGKQSRHNSNYWQFGDYLGIGAGAHGKISLAMPEKIIRTLKPKNPTAYLEQNLAQTQATAIMRDDLPLEFLMNHLRLRSGFSLYDYQMATGLNPETLEPTLSGCLKENLLIKQDIRYHCSNKGWNFLDTILEKFAP